MGMSFLGSRIVDNNGQNGFYDMIGWLKFTLHNLAKSVESYQALSAQVWEQDLGPHRAASTSAIKEFVCMQNHQMNIKNFCIIKYQNRM